MRMFEMCQRSHRRFCDKAGRATVVITVASGLAFSMLASPATAECDHEINSARLSTAAASIVAPQRGQASNGTDWRRGDFYRASTGSSVAAVVATIQHGQRAPQGNYWRRGDFPQASTD